MLWGFTPSINAFRKCPNVNPWKDQDEINILISETGGDMRHVLKTISDILPLKMYRQKKINIYYHEKQKENLARLMLFLTLISETGIS